MLAFHAVGSPSSISRRRRIHHIYQMPHGNQFKPIQRYVSCHETMVLSVHLCQPSLRSAEALFPSTNHSPPSQTPHLSVSCCPPATFPTQVALPILILAHHVSRAEWLDVPSLTRCQPDEAGLGRISALLWAFEGGNSRLTSHSMAFLLCCLVNLLTWGPLLSRER